MRKRTLWRPAARRRGGGIIWWRERMHFCARKSIAMASSGRKQTAPCSTVRTGNPFKWPHGEQGTLELFGRIDDSSVARVEICQMRRDKWDGEMQDYVYQTRCVYPVDELIEDGGRRYFLGTYRLDEKPRSDGEYDRFVLSAYDAAGERTAEYEITNFS